MREDLLLIRSVILDERYDLLDRIKPTAMSRAEFSRAVLRELARRGTLEESYDRRFGEVAQLQATVERPLKAEPANRRTVTGDVVTIALNDAASNAVVNPERPEAFRINIESDVATQVGIPVRTDGKLAGIDTRTDTAAYDLGYTLGALPQFRRGAPFQKGLTFVQTLDIAGQAYCPIVNEIYSSVGRASNQREAFAAGFVQARIDTNSNFGEQTAAIGLFTPCPPITPRPTSRDRDNFALR